MEELLERLEGKQITLNHGLLEYEVIIIDTNIVPEDSTEESTITFLSKDNRVFKFNMYNFYSLYIPPSKLYLTLTLGNDERGLKF